MKKRLWFPARGRALRRLFEAALTLFFFVSSADALFAASGDFEATLGGYVTRMILALSLLGLAGYAVAKYMPGRFATRAGGRLRLIGALNLGRDMLYIVQTGPEVVALFVSKSGSTVLGRWTLDEWEDYEAAFSDDAKRDPEIREVDEVR